MAAGESFGAVAKRRLFGLGYIALVIALVWLSVAFYQKKFTPVALVTLVTDHTGNALQQGSDVKERGLIVGEVRGVAAETGSNRYCQDPAQPCVKVTLALNPSDTDLIPKTVSAQILPKTVFGEQYVSLNPRNGTSPMQGPHIQAGDTIQQDRSRGALETQKVLGDLLPLLQAVKPAELNATLTAVAGALRGRGKELGDSIVQLDTYLKGFNPHVRQLADDLAKLGNLSDEYNAVAPDLLATLDNLRSNAHTLIAERHNLSTLLTTATDTSNVMRSFLAQNRSRLITVNATSARIYSLLARYSPEFPCLFAGMAKLYHGSQRVIGSSHGFRLSIVLDQTNQGPYRQGQTPFLVSGYGPSCFGLPNHPRPQVDGHFQIPPKYQCLNDGAPLTKNPCGQKPSRNHQASPQGDNADSSDPKQSASVSQLGVDSPAEHALVSTLISGSYGGNPDRVPPIATMLAAPLLRGQEVSVQ